MFNGGTLLGEYNGPAKAGEWIVVEQKEQTPEGRYVLLQKNNEGLDDNDWQLHVAELAAFGRYNGQVFTECEGWHQPEVRFSSSYPHSLYDIAGIFTDGGKYWLTPDRYIGRGFTIKISNCSVSIAGILIRNVNHGLRRATKVFRIFGSLNKTDVGEQLLEEEIENPLTTRAPAPTIETFYFNKATKVKYLSFELARYWGSIGGGLDFFGVITESGNISIFF